MSRADNPIVEGHLVTKDGVTQEISRGTIERLLASSETFWLDLDGLDSEGSTLLSDTFGFHALAIEDAERFGQRPKLDPYDEVTVLVLYGANQGSDLVEVHCFCAERFLVTIHQVPCPSLRELAERLHERGLGASDLITLLHKIVDTLIDGFFPVLDRLDDEIDDLEDQILEQPTETQLGRLFDMKRSLISLRRVVTPERDVFAGLLTGATSLPNMTPEAERYFRDVYDHLIRISDLVDSYRDLMSGALDTYLSTVSNRLNVIMKQLTIIATIFLPLSFLTGFFGQNFAWMVSHIGGLGWFVALGIGTQVIAVGLLVVFFRRRGWLTTEGTVPAVSAAGRRGAGGRRA